MGRGGLEHVLVVDDGTLEEALNHDVLVTDFDENLNDTRLDDLDVSDFVAFLHEQAACVLLVSLQTVDNLIENCVSVIEMGEERDLLKGHLDEAHVFVTIVEDALFDELEDLRVTMADVREVLLVQFADRAVLHCDDRGSSLAVVDEGDLTEKLALAENLHLEMLV